MADKWCIVVPVMYADGKKSLATGYDFNGEVSLRPLPDWLKGSTPADFVDDDLRTYLEPLDFGYIAEYPGFTLYDIDKGGDKPRPLVERAFEQIEFANLALWLAKPTFMRYSRYVITFYNGNSWRLLTKGNVRPLLSRQRERTSVLDNADLSHAGEIMNAILRVPPDSSVGLALRTLSQALTDDWWESRYLFLWVALESLYGPKDARELSYRLALRIALFLAESGDTAREIFRAAKMGYDWRSKVVHGVKTKNNDSELPELMLCTTEAILRRSIRQIILDAHIMQRFAGKDRELYLDGLVFASGKATPTA